MSWKRWVEHTSTEPALIDVMRSRSRHWEQYRFDRCPIENCEQHPTPLVDRLDLIDPDQGFWRIVEPQMKGTP